MPAPAPARHREGPPKQQQGYSLSALIRSKLHDPQLDVRAGEGDNEARVSDAILATVPESLRVRGAMAMPYRPSAAVLTGNAPAPGALAPSRLDMGQVLRPVLALERLGARRVELPEGYAGRSVTSPVSITAGWSDPQTGETVPAQQFALGATNVTLRELTVEVELSRLLLRQSTRTESLVRELFRVACEGEHERATIAGTGRNGQPLGLVTMAESGILPTSPAVGSLPTYSELTAGLQVALDAGAHLRRSGWLLPMADWDDYQVLQHPGGYPALVNGTLAGRPVEFSPFLPSGKAIAGEFAELEVTYQGAPQMLVNPYTKANMSITKISIFDYIDATVRRPSLLTLIGA